MTFSIDTGNTATAYIPQGDAIDDGMSLKFIDWTRADRTKRKIVEAIENIESLPDLEGYYEAEDAVIDALHLFDDTMSAEIVALYQERRAALKYGAQPYSAERQNAHPAQPGTQAQSPNSANRPTQKGTNMFNLDTGNSGSEGPWLSWSARGTQDGAVPQQSFYIRDENGSKTVFDMSNGIVLDIENMKTGWQRSDGIVGQAPDWKWNATVSQMMPQPGDDYKKGFEVKCAVGGGKTATWQQAGAAVWGALTMLAPQLSQGPAGKLPLVRMTGTKPVQFKRGSTVEPVLEVAQWVDRPDCLKEGVAAGIAAEPAPAPQAQPAPQPAPQPAASSVPASASF